MVEAIGLMSRLGRLKVWYDIFHMVMFNQNVDHVD